MHLVACLNFMLTLQCLTLNQNLKKTRRIILYCASGGRSALAVTTLKEMGFTNVAHLDGGLKAWKDSGKPIVE